MYILPNPHCLKSMEGRYIITCGSRIVIDRAWGAEVFAYAALLQEDMCRTTGFELPVLKGRAEDGDIRLNYGEGMKLEEYRLNIRAAGIELEASFINGLLMGVQTLRQMMRQGGAVLPCMEIHDWPEIAERGFYHDVTRGRIPTLASMKALADTCSFYKLNQLQLYVEHSYMFSGLSEMWRDDTPLTAEEIMELDTYCQGLNIELVPSLASFGHLYKVIRTKKYSHLCELEEPGKVPFSTIDRMLHHTLDVRNDGSLELVREMIEEYAALFTSKRFNICGDETFDLGRGKNAGYAKELGAQILSEEAGGDRTDEELMAAGIQKIYIDFVGKVCDIVKGLGLRPMFWGDIICNFPEAVKELPEDVICLNWGYAPDQTETDTRNLHEAGAVQYLCPGVTGWNRLINQIEDSYKNIKKMCGYAHKYGALGVLNTDWGDYGHVNHPEFSTAGLIYGAEFSWNKEDIAFEEMNRRISAVEYLDSSESLVSVLAELSVQSVFRWSHAIAFMEQVRDEFPLDSPRENCKKEIQKVMELNADVFREANERLLKGEDQAAGLIAHLDTSTRKLVPPYLTASEGMRIFNDIGEIIRRHWAKKEGGRDLDPWKTAERLEVWFARYQKLWLSVSKPSELYRVREIISWYGDFLRGL